MSPYFNPKIGHSELGALSRVLWMKVNGKFPAASRSNECKFITIFTSGELQVRRIVWGCSGETSPHHVFGMDLLILFQSGGQILQRIVPNKIFEIPALQRNSCEKLLHVNFGRHNSFMVQIELIKLIKQKRNQSVGSSALHKP